MISRARWIAVGIFALLATLVAGVLVGSRPDPTVEALLSSEYMSDSAIESEVVEAEVAGWGDRQFLKLAEALSREVGPRKRFRSWLWDHVPALRDELNPIAGASMDRQGRILRILTAAGPRARVAENAVLPLISDPNSESLDAAILALARLRGDGPDAVQLQVSRVISASAGDLRRIAPLWCSQVSEPPVELIPFLIRLLSSRQEQERAAAARSLAMFGTRASAAAAPLRDMLADRSRIVRPRAALALGTVAPEFAREAVAVMMEQQRTNVSWTGDMAHRLYFEVGPAAIAAAPLLTAELSRSKEKVTHGAAAAALWRIDHAVTPERVAALIWDAEHGVQRNQIRSIQVLGEMGPPAIAAAPSLERLTHRRLVLIRQYAGAALKRISGGAGSATKP